MPISKHSGKERRKQEGEDLAAWIQGTLGDRKLCQGQVNVASRGLVYV